MPIVNVSIKSAAPAEPYKLLLEPQQNVLLNINHSFCICFPLLGLLIKTGSIKKKKNDDTNYHLSFLKVQGGGRMSNMVKIGGVTQMVVVLSHKEMSCLVVGMFDDSVGPLSY